MRKRDPPFRIGSVVMERGSYPLPKKMGVVIKIRPSQVSTEIMHGERRTTYWVHIRWFEGGTQIKFERYLKVVSY